MESVRGKTSTEQSREHCLKIQADPNKLTLSRKRKKNRRTSEQNKSLFFQRTQKVLKQSGSMSVNKKLHKELQKNKQSCKKTSRAASRLIYKEMKQTMQGKKLIVHIQKNLPIH